MKRTLVVLGIILGVLIILILFAVFILNIDLKSEIIDLPNKMPK